MTVKFEIKLSEELKRKIQDVLIKARNLTLFGLGALVVISGVFYIGMRIVLTAMGLL